MTFTETWFSVTAQATLADLAREVRDIPGRVIEIGSWEGASSVALANAVHPRVVECVDTWRGSPGEPSETLAAGRDVFATWQSNIEQLTAGNVRSHRCDWRVYSASDTSPVAFLFIDAEHTYREVFDAITAFLPRMAAGGIMCGDDIHHPPVKQAVIDTLNGTECYTNGPLWIRR